jgi:hypothetical protein
MSEVISIAKLPTTSGCPISDQMIDGTFHINVVPSLLRLDSESEPSELMSTEFSDDGSVTVKPLAFRRGSGPRRRQIRCPRRT